MTDVLQVETVQFTGYQRALEAAERLKQKDPKHELLRLVQKWSSPDTNRWEQELIDRFFRCPPGKDGDFIPFPEMEDICFNALADAMERVLKSIPNIEIERVHVMLDPMIEVFTVTMEQGKVRHTHTAPSLEHLNTFFAGVRAASTFFDCFISNPVIPPPFRRLVARLEVKETPQVGRNGSG